MSDAPDSTQPYDFGASTLLSPRQMRKLRAHEGQFLSAAEARVALLLRAEFPLKLAGIRILPYQKLVESWTNPAHLTLFKTEPLRGVSILDMPIALGLAFVDRLLGGQGRAEKADRELSEIEKALLEQIVQILLEEWCNNWAGIKPLKPALLGSESNGRYLQTAPPQANMLVLTLEARLGECQGEVQLAFPYAMLEPLLRQLCGPAEPVAEPAGTAVKWKHCLDDVALPVIAEWQGLEMSAREILHLKIGDVVPVKPQSARHVILRLGDLSIFTGRLGTIAGHWAVELAGDSKT